MLLAQGSKAGSIVPAQDLAPNDPSLKIVPNVLFSS